MMEKNAELYDFTQYTQGVVWQAAFQQAIQDQTESSNLPQVPTLLQIRRGYAESPGWMMVQAAEFEPEPLTVERFRKRAVYSSANLTLALLEMLASEKWLDRRGNEYFLTGEGREIVQQGQQRRIEPFQSFMPIPEKNIKRLTDLIRRVIEESLKADTPPGTWSLTHSRNRAPGDDVSDLAHFIQFCSDFNAFRDDAHMAAYGAHSDTPGHIWEAFSQIVTEEARNADDLYQNLAYRGFYTEDWQAALDELAKRGWLVQNGGAYSITQAGKEERQRVETLTDQYFYAPWTVLSNDEFIDLTDQMLVLNESCKQFLK